jgi:hypothetical protein
MTMDDVLNAQFGAYILSIVFCYYFYFTKNKYSFRLSFVLFLFVEFCLHKMCEAEPQMCFMRAPFVLLLRHKVGVTLLTNLALGMIQYVLPFHMFFFMAAQAVLD